MKTTIITVLLVIAVIGGYRETLACQSEPYALFQEEARALLDSLEQSGSVDTFTMAVLAHNLAFHKSKEMRKRAQQWLAPLYKDIERRSPLISIYWESLGMMEVRDQTIASKLITFLSGSSPKRKVRQAYHRMTTALEQDSTNEVMLFIHAAVAIEIAEYLPEFLPAAHRDLTNLRDLIDTTDTVRMFFFELLWAKYYYKQAKLTHERTALYQSRLALERARRYGCTAYHAQEIKWWDERSQKELSLSR